MAPAGSRSGQAVGGPQRSRPGRAVPLCHARPFQPPGELNKNTYVGHLGTWTQRSSLASPSPAPGLGVCFSEKPVCAGPREEAPGAPHPSLGAAAQNLDWVAAFLPNVRSNLCGCLHQRAGLRPWGPPSLDLCGQMLTKSISFHQPESLSVEFPRHPLSICPSVQH